jgi:hypothetical protein
LITKNKIIPAYKIFKRIAFSNKKPIENLPELESLNLNTIEINDRYNKSKDAENMIIEKLASDTKEDDKIPTVCYFI